MHTTYRGCARPGLREALETSLFEVVVEGERFRDAQLPHDREARAIRQTPALVPGALEDVESRREVFGVYPYHDQARIPEQGPYKTRGIIDVRQGADEARRLVENEARCDDRAVDTSGNLLVELGRGGSIPVRREVFGNMSRASSRSITIVVMATMLYAGPVEAGVA